MECQDQIEELDRIFEGQTPAVMEVRRALLDAAQRKRVLIGPRTLINSVVPQEASRCSSS